MSALNLDRSIFSVFCQYRTGLEATVDPMMTRAEVIDNIVRGELGFERERIAVITEHNPIEKWSRIITDEIFSEVDSLRDPDRPLTGQDLQDWKWDHDRDSRKHEVA